MRRLQGRPSQSHATQEAGRCRIGLALDSQLSSAFALELSRPIGRESLTSTQHPTLEARPLTCSDRTSCCCCCDCKTCVCGMMRDGTEASTSSECGESRC